MPIQSIRCPTLLGWFEIDWTEKGIRRVVLPGPQPPPQAKLSHSKQPGCSCNLPPEVQDLCDRLASWARGIRTEFRDIPLDLPDLSPFARSVHNVVREIPFGQTTTYGHVAREVRRPRAARAVGAALRANPVPILVPCHRVLGASGALVGFNAPGGTRTKRILLALEGVSTQAPPSGAHGVHPPVTAPFERHPHMPSHREPRRPSSKPVP